MFVAQNRFLCVTVPMASEGVKITDNTKNTNVYIWACMCIKDGRNKVPSQSSGPLGISSASLLASVTSALLNASTPANLGVLMLSIIGCAVESYISLSYEWPQAQLCPWFLLAHLDIHINCWQLSIQDINVMYWMYIFDLSKGHLPGSSESCMCSVIFPSVFVHSTCKISLKLWKAMHTCNVWGNCKGEIIGWTVSSSACMMCNDLSQCSSFMACHQPLYH